MRLLAGISNWAWMGNVYKVVYFIKAMMPGLTYHTFGGRGQRVAWQERRPQPESGALSIEKIANMTYEDFVETRKATLNEASDEDIFAAVGEFLVKGRSAPQAVETAV